MKLNGGTGSWELEGFEGKEPDISKRALNLCENTFAMNAHLQWLRYNSLMVS